MQLESIGVAKSLDGKRCTVIETMWNAFAPRFGLLLCIVRSCGIEDSSIIGRCASMCLFLYNACQPVGKGEAPRLPHTALWWAKRPSTNPLGAMVNGRKGVPNWVLGRPSDIRSTLALAGLALSLHPSPTPVSPRQPLPVASSPFYTPLVSVFFAIWTFGSRLFWGV